MTTLRLDPYIPGKGQSKYGGPVWYEEPEKQDADINIERLVLDAVRNTKELKNVEVSDIILEGEIERTMEGASTFRITLHDPEDVIENLPILKRAIDVELDGLWFRLVAVNKDGSALELIFEDRIIAYLRAHKKVRRSSRGKLTRLEFCLMLVRVVKKERIRVVCPELFTKQPMEKLSSEDQSAIEVSRDVNRSSGFGPGAEVKVKGATATKRQRRVLTDILEAGIDMRVGEKLMLAAVMTVTQESVAGKLLLSSSGQHFGAFHQERSRGIPFRQTVWEQLGGATGDNYKDAKAFYKQAKKVLKDNPKYSAAQIALDTQRPGGGPEQYGQWREEAANTVSQFSGEVVEERVYRKRFSFSTEDNGKAQNYWDAIKSILSTTEFACFVSNGILYMISEPRLFKSRSRMILTRKTPGVMDISYGIDDGKDEASATVTCRAGRWVAPPGSIVELKDCGRASGKWLVASIIRNVYSRDATIKLKKPVKPLPEPAPEVARVSVEETTAAGFRPGLGYPGPVAEAYREAKRIDGKHYPYVWGGGHASAGKPDGGTGRDPGTGYDCSGSVAAVLAAGGAYEKGDSVGRSDTLGAMYVSGEGKYMTIWANAEHVFVEFYPRGKKNKAEHFGTGDWGKGWRGAGFNPNLHFKSGFKASHPRGW